MQEESLLPPLPYSEETGLPDLSGARFFPWYLYGICLRSDTKDTHFSVFRYLSGVGIPIDTLALNKCQFFAQIRKICVRPGISKSIFSHKIPDPSGRKGPRSKKPLEKSGRKGLAPKPISQPLPRNGIHPARIRRRLPLRPPEPGRRSHRARIR